MEVVRTGLLWILKSDITQRQLETLRLIYKYPHPKDDTVIFETFIELPDRIGIPAGNLEKVERTLGEINIIDKRIAPKFSKKKKSKLKLREYQVVAHKEILDFFKSNGTCFNLGGEPGSGKSFMLANVIADLGVKTLIIAHLSSLTEQLADEIEAVLGERPVVLDAKNRELGDINIATSQFISQNPDIWYKIKNGIGLLVVDEAESLASLTTMRIFQRAHAKYHIFISATFTRSVDKRTEALVDFAGDKSVVLKNDKLIKPQVIWVDMPEVFYAPMSKFQYAKSKGNFFLSPSIDEKVIKVIKSSLKKGRQVLVAVDVVEMQERIRDKLEVLGIKAECFNRKLSKDRRKEVLEAYDRGTIQVLLGFQVLNAGLSIPKISTIIRVSTPSSREKLDQLIGRGRRDYEGKDGCFVIDFAFKGFNISARMSFYKTQRRRENWKLMRISWEEFERKYL